MHVDQKVGLVEGRSLQLDDHADAPFTCGPANDRLDQLPGCSLVHPQKARCGFRPAQMKKIIPCSSGERR